MPIAVTCASCGAKLKAPDGAAGRTLKCPRSAAAVSVPHSSSDARQSGIPSPTPFQSEEPSHGAGVANAPITRPLIGLTDAICPYCNHKLGSMPGRKKKCPACRNAIFVRTRPQDRARILVREDELPAVENLWAVHRASQPIRTIEIVVTLPLERVHRRGQNDDDELGFAVEWITAGDEGLCPLCRPLEGIVLTEDEAQDMIPRHESCRCCWTPANVGEDKSKQKRSQKSIQEAIDKLIMAEIPKGSTRTIAQQKQRSSWAGAKKTIAKKRPKSLFD